MKNLLLSFLAVLPFAVFAANPVIISSSVVTSATICSESEGSLVLYQFVATDADGDELSISGAVSNNTSVMDNSEISYEPYQVIGNDYYFEVYGNPSDAGIFALSITVTDGNTSANMLFPQITVVDVTAPEFTTDLIELCTGNGIIDLNNYVTVPGGNFTNWDYEITFTHGDFDTDNSPISTEDTITLNYEVDIYGCYYPVYGSLVIYSSASMGTETTEATCGQTNGTAQVFLDAPSGTTILWSNGIQNEETVAGLASGSYSVSVTTPQGCTSQEFFQIGLSGVSIDSDITNVSCFGLSDGGVEIDPSGLTSPLSVIWSSGHSTQNLSGVPAGFYTVNITDAANCHYSETFEIYGPPEIFVDAILTRPTCGEEDGEIEIDQAYGGTGDFTYTWNNGNNGSSIDDLGADIYTVTVTDENNCIQTKAFFLSDIDGADIYGTVVPASCNGTDGAVIVTAWPMGGSSILSVEWSNGASTLSISNVGPDNYICTLLTDNNCKAIKAWNVPVVKPLQNNICVVTVDDETTTNLVVWQRVQTEGIDYYKIYRETSMPGNFAFIDTVKTPGEPIFNDVVASPVERSWKYKISAVNYCGTEGPLSMPHQTIHLDVIDNSPSGVTINWNAYVGTQFSNYHLSRYTDANGWEDVATLPANQLSYDDVFPITTAGLDYVVEMELDVECSTEKAQDFNSSRSNKDKATFVAGDGTGDSNNGIEEGYLQSIGIAPNPATSELVISQLDEQELTITVLNPEGQVVMVKTISDLSNTLSLNDLSAGVYLINIQLNNTAQTFRIVKI